ncbi:HepT-like ribonuclease domain-containing protein [Anaeromyxobacter soli]|uniref:HepT-like ribonuclease domain-containing protein n=1 Tax=Anaeromyxobacter soli TaxID=2922725 RepID=UPI001FAF3AD8|nr:DUF86 domain-containing protein [Anaeromyxobacter sp. SG29]
MRPDDVIRLRHMLDAAREAMSFAAGRSRGDLERDRMLVLAIVKDVEIIGEAAARVSPAMQASHPEIPWAQIIATRNRLIHAYFDVDLQVVWDTVTDDVPQLVRLLEPFVPS